MGEIRFDCFNTRQYIFHFPMCSFHCSISHFVVVSVFGSIVYKIFLPAILIALSVIIIIRFAMSSVIITQVLPVCLLILIGVVVGIFLTKYKREISSVCFEFEDRIRNDVTHKDLFIGMVYAFVAVLFCGILILPAAIVGAQQISIAEPKMHYLLIIVMKTVSMVFIASTFFMSLCLLISVFVGKKTECNSRFNKKNRDNL